MNPRRVWTARLAVGAFRGVFTLMALAWFGIVWRPLVVALVALIVAGVAAVALAAAARLVLLRWRGW